ncbi:MAG: Mur ligase family protein [Patescibacteria group bacterium]|nr:Mur ligase family protein [Patescibacteria group bacterium]
MLRKIKNFFHLIEALIANIIYSFPSKKIKVIGVTGTDGKTTTTSFLAHLLKQSGKKVSFVSTVYAQIADKIYDTGLHVTTPSSFMIQRFLNKAVKNKDEFFVLETTSHALDQNRVWGVNFEIGVLTNITHEHLDYHKTYENYVKAKCKLLKNSKIIVINQEDNSYKYVLNQIKNSKLKIQNYNSKLKILDKVPNLTKFNRFNFSAGYQVAKILNISDDDFLKAVKTFKLPQGRLDLIYDKDFKVIIDFAHTPNAFKELLPEIKKIYLKKSGRLIHVFGSAGLRDSSKRPLMGRYSSQYSDYIILTEEDYRTEDPKKICQQIASGFINKKINYETIINRKEAIKKALKMAKKNDVVLLTGKGHEKSLCRGKKEYPWSDYEAVKEILKIN